MLQLREFWQWFEEHREIFYHLPQFTLQEQAFYHEALDIRLTAYHPHLAYVFLFPKENENAELILTTNGQSDGMLWVKNLVLQAPSIPGWDITAFIPPKIQVEALKKGEEPPYKFKEVHLNPCHIVWTPVGMNEINDKHELLFHIKGLGHELEPVPYEKYIEYLGIVLLDFLGEIEVNRHIEQIYYDPVEFDGGEWYPLYRLPEYLAGESLEE